LRKSSSTSGRTLAATPTAGMRRGDRNEEARMNTKRSSWIPARGRLAWLAWLLWCPLLAASVALAQSIDDGYQPDVGGGPVMTVHESDDGSLLIGGLLSSVDGVARNRLARLRADGSLDPTFDAAIAGVNARVRAVHQHSAGGSVLIAGNFTSVGGQARSNFARVNASGVPDAGFNVPVNNTVNDFYVVPTPGGNGVIYLAGEFTTVNGVPRNRAAAVLANGSLGASFNPPNLSSGWYNTVDPHNGGLLLAGAFTLAGVDRTIIRVQQASGALDPAFNVTTWAAGGTLYNQIRDVAVLPDGRILIAGGFTEVNGQPRNRIARLHADGSLDDSFVPPTGINDTIRSMHLRSDGRVVIGGSFTNLGNLRDGVAMLDADGSLVTDFAVNQQPDGTVYVVHGQSDGWTLIAGDFTAVNTETRNRVARLAPDGLLERTLTVTGASDGGIEAIGYQSNGRIVVGGRFTQQFNGASRQHLARVYSYGGNDTTFSATANADVYAMAVLPDDRIVIGGSFGTVNGSQRRRVARLHADGSLDSTFGNPQVNGGFVRTLVTLPDGKILIGGSFTEIGGAARERLARLNANGTLDPTFASVQLNGVVRAIVVQPDGRIVIGGGFTTVNNFQRARIARLTANGSFDPSFNASATANGVVHALAQAANGDILVGGDFTSIGSTSRSRLAALSPDGALTGSLNISANDLVLSLVPRTDGRILVGGSFTSIGGLARTRMALLTSSAVVPEFDVPFSGQVRAVLVQPDGKVLAGGAFDEVDGSTRMRLARLRTPTGGARQSLQWSESAETLTWSPTGIGPTVMGVPRVLVATMCCDDQDFVELPGGGAMQRIGVGHNWILSGFSGLAGDFYVRIEYRAGDHKGGSTAIMRSPVHLFTGEEPVPPDDVADIKVTIDADSTSAQSGDIVEFTITVGNSGPDPVFDVAVDAMVPVGWQIIDHEASHGTWVPGTGVWSVGPMAVVGDTSMVDLTVRARAPAGTASHTYVATVRDGAWIDPDPGNNTASVTVNVIHVPQADLAVDGVIFTPAQAGVGDTVQVRIDIRNVAGDDSAPGVVNAPLPAGLQYLGASLTQGSYAPATGIWDFGTLDVGDVAWLEIEASVLASGPYSVEAFVVGDWVDPQLDNNTRWGELMIFGGDDIIFANGFD
jgi:uncharacterized delta-60 repeat protein/uncharacterized repeat protein (TIGR01451 family)